MEDSLPTIWPLFVCGILVLCGFASWWAVHHTKRYAEVERRALSYVADKLRRKSEDGSKQQTEGTPELILVESLLEGLSKETLIADRLQLIRQMRKSHSKVNLNALQQMTLAREGRTKWLALPSYAASLSMMLGLLGTVVGLAIMVRQIDLGLPLDTAQVTMDSLTSSISHIRSVLSGMNTAFSATIAGITAAIVLSSLNHRLAHAQSAFLDELDRFTAETLLPATVPSAEDDSLLEKVSLQLERSFGRLDEISKNNNEALTQLSAIEKGFVEIVETIRQTTKTDSLEHTQELIGRTTGILDHVADLNKSVVIVAERLPEIVKQTGQANQVNVSQIDRLIRSYESQAKVFQAATTAGPAQLPLWAKVAFACVVALNLVLAYALLK